MPRIAQYQILLASLLFSSCAHHPTPSQQSKKGFLYGEHTQFQWPVHGKVSSHFGRRGFSMHRGLDIAAPAGTKITASAAGVVLFSGYKRGYGLTVILKHGKYRTLYAHCRKSFVTVGESVFSGQPIAEVGRSGNARGAHLHFEVRTDHWTAMNPLDYLPL